MDNVNLTNEELLNDADQREWSLNCLRKGDSYTLRESHIWTKLNPNFSTVCGVYMTMNQVADFFGVDKATIKSYNRLERNGKPNEYRKELDKAGLISPDNEECKKMVENFMGSDTTHENLDNDVTDSWQIHSRGAVLYSLEAVMKLGMFMTGTPSAVKFRDLIIEEIKNGTVFEKAYHTALEGYLNQMKISAQEGHIFDIEILNNVMDSVSDTSLICYKNKILDTIDILYEVIDEYKLLQQKTSMSNRRFYSQIQAMVEQLTLAVTELQSVIIELDSVRLNANTSKDLYNRTEILEDAIANYKNDPDYSTRKYFVNQFVIDSKYYKVDVDYQAPLKDKAGNKIVYDKSQCDSKSNLFIDINGNQHVGKRAISYVPDDSEKEWIFNNEYVMKPEVKNQILKFTPVGRSLWGALYKQASQAYDEIVAEIKEDEDIKNYIESHPKKVNKIVAKHVNLDKEEFEAQYAYTILNNKQNTIILL